MAVAAVALFCILATLSHALQVATDSGPNQMRPRRRKADVTIPQGLVAGPPAEKSVQCNWGGVNSYFLYALPEAQQDAILRSLQKYGLKVVRIFIDTVSKDHKDSGSFFVPHLEPDHMGQYDTTVLELINKLMVKVQLYGIKLAIALHDRYSLGCYSCDGYQKDLQLNCIAPKCSRLNDATEFYKSNVAIEFFDKRLRMILNYKNPLLGKRWGELKDVVAMYEIQNEAQGLDSSWVEGWHCARANVIRSSISSEILIGTGGGRTFASSSRLEHFYCPDIDVVTLHDYDSTSWTQMYGGILAARDLGLTYGKKVVHEEFGREHKLARPDYFYAVISAAVDLGVPFMPWQYVIPANNRDDDYEFDERQAAWPVLVFGVLQANATPAAFTWSNLELCTVA